MKSYSHLNRIIETESDWQTTILKTSTSSKLWLNPDVKIFLDYIERMIVITRNRVTYYFTYFKF